MFLCLLLCVGACLMSKRELFPPPPDGPPPKTVYVMSNGWHAGLVLPCADIPSEVWPACPDFAGHRFVEVGWGAKGFYMARNISATLVLRTLCWPSPSVIHVVGFDEPPEQVFKQVDLVEIQLSEAGYRNLCQFVGDAMARDAEGQPVRLGPGLYGVSQFYDALGVYYYPNTCNQWTARALRAAGCPITPIYASTAHNVMFQVRRFGRVVRER
jgi:uncharacterized protein (TIGR02117 family)